MDSVTLSSNNQSLKALLKDFYILTGVQTVIFDTEHTPIVAYPENATGFCDLMQQNKHTYAKCCEYDEKSFCHCQKTSEMVVYRCYAGLVEATAPLIDNGVTIGYIMLGQVTDCPDTAKVTEQLRSVIEKYQLTDQVTSDSVYDIPYKSTEQIYAAAKLLESCTFYILQKNMITLRRQNFMKNMNAFLLEHLGEDLSIERLMREFNVSRNKLYDSCKKYLGIGIAEHIKNLRIQEAKRLLKETSLSITEIAYKVGFMDYNYFCRTFKKEVGMPAHRYRKEHT